MTPGADWFDVVLAVLVPFLAWRVLAADDLFKATVLFIVFGLLLALVWVRLRAPDVALAEAAIGAGLTGALFLSALGRLQRTDRGRAEAPQRENTATQGNPAIQPVMSSSLRGPGLALLSVAVAIILGWTVLSLPIQEIGLSEQVRGKLAQSGVTNPVTAVLLNFRGYDTLLEIGVLLLAVCGVWSLGTAEAAHSAQRPRTTSPVLQVFIQFFAPVMIMVGGYLLWIGASAPGGAFQGGAVIAALAVILLLSRKPLTLEQRSWWLRTTLVLGFIVFLAVALGVIGVGNRFLEYPTTWASSLILVIETALTVSIAVILAALFASSLVASSSAEGTSSVQEQHE
jgi:multisubunit Na+/H+ antiporter MnhB subunit